MNRKDVIQESLSCIINQKAHTFLVPLNYDRYFKTVFSDMIQKIFLMIFNTRSNLTLCKNKPKQYLYKKENVNGTNLYTTYYHY